MPGTREHLPAPVRTERQDVRKQGGRNDSVPLAKEHPRGATNFTETGAQVGVPQPGESAFKPRGPRTRSFSEDSLEVACCSPCLRGAARLEGRETRQCTG